MSEEVGLYHAEHEESAPSPGFRCPICGSENHGAEAHEERGAPPAGLRCALCGSENHRSEDCPSRRERQ
jgi:hypothetical protein